MQTVDAALEAIYNVVQYDAATITSYSQRTQRLDVIGRATPGIAGHPLGVCESIRIDPDLFDMDYVYRADAEVVFSVDHQLHSAGLRSRLTIPVSVDGHRLGMLNLGSKIKHGVRPPVLFYEQVHAITRLTLVTRRIGCAETLARLASAVSYEDRDTVDRVLSHLADGLLGRPAPLRRVV